MIPTRHPFFSAIFEFLIVYFDGDARRKGMRTKERKKISTVVKLTEEACVLYVK